MSFPFPTMKKFTSETKFTMLEVCANACTRESVDYRRNSAVDNHPFGLTSVIENSVDKRTEDNKSTVTVDARFRQNGELAMSVCPRI